MPAHDHETIYHITTPELWAQARSQGLYTPESLSSEGFVHCSTGEQVVESAERHYRGQTGLILLAIDPTLVRAEVRWEDTAGRGEKFPHIYGPIDLASVRSVIELPSRADGGFELPD